MRLNHKAPLWPQVARYYGKGLRIVDRKDGKEYQVCDFVLEPEDGSDQLVLLTKVGDGPDPDYLGFTPDEVVPVLRPMDMFSSELGQQLFDLSGGKIETKGQALMVSYLYGKGVPTGAKLGFFQPDGDYVSYEHAYAGKGQATVLEMMLGKPLVALQLLAEGYDVFGLIASGEAFTTQRTIDSQWSQLPQQ